MSRTLVIASDNTGKQAEMVRLLPEGFTVVVAREAGVTLPPETGTTFEENALLKALHTAEQSGHYAIGDDSGLEVDALGGEPGVYSARYAGEPSNSARNIAKLLRAMHDVPDDQRTARFRCAIVLAGPDGSTVTEEGVVEGHIGRSPRGSDGFGYDPIFVASDGRTFAEISAHEKDTMSHRGQALRKLIPAIMAISEIHGN
ncbi:MAG: RdgB/HAM1 family non-canonical purine NTP pyrophosphatase [Thermomicrobiales bacterium]